MSVPQSRAVQQLAEVLTTLVSSSTEAAASQGAVERISECFDSEVGALVRGGAVVASVGFRADGPVPAALIEVAGGGVDTLAVPGAGICRAVVVTVASESPSRLVLARSGDDGYSLEEVSLLRSMGRILANALDMLHLRDRVAASEARFRRIVETANEGIWLLGVDGVTTFANDKTAEILGYPPEEMPGLSLFDVLDEAGREQAVRNLERRRQGLSDQFECGFYRKDGARVWVLLNASPLLDGDGSFAGSLCMISDISHRKATEEALRETTARLQLLQAMATAANQASCLDEALQVAVSEICAHTGWVAGHAYLPGDPTGVAVVPLPIWHVEDDARFGVLRSALAVDRRVPAAGLVRRVLSAREPAWAETTGTDRPDIERLAAAVGLPGAFAFPVSVGDEVTCVLEFFATSPSHPDPHLVETIRQVATQLSRVAERERANNELATARDAAMESSRLKSDFLATMSHEIRTPMNGVIGLTGLLLSTELDDRQRQYAEGVQTAGESLLAIINDILDFSKIEAERLELEVVDFDLVQVVEEAVALVVQGAQRKGLELVTSCGPDLPTVVRGDPARIRQVLLNLASNAVKFTHTGEVVVRADLLGDAGDGVVVRFEVTDTGIGITESHRQRIFEPFSQADASTTRRFGGTGLGLAISRRLVAAMGGELDFESVPGKGSTFRCTVPLERGAGARRLGAPLPAPAGGLRVLVVDDNESSRGALRDQLRAWGLVADTAPGGPAALAMLHEAASGGRRYDLAILDTGMAGMDGFELARRVATDPAVSATRLVMLTSPGAIGWNSATGARITATLAKPVRLSQLADALVHTGPVTPGGRVSPLPLTPPQDSRGHVLVVEDNASNQLVAVGMLRLLGFHTDVASDGVEALEALGRSEFDAILMDCQMPEMDGFTATSEIRRLERGHRHTPVIAMTAGASDSDRERCLAAGMDDFLSKPVKARDLDAAMVRWVPAVGTPRPAPAGSEPSVDYEPSVDHEIVEELRGLAPDGSLLVQIVDAFLESVPEHLADLTAAVDAADAALVRRASHRLKGESASVGAVEMARLCASLEELGLAGRLEGAPALASAVGRAFERAAEELGAAAGRGSLTRGARAS